MTPSPKQEELEVVWPLFASAILMSVTFSLCQTPSTASWMWQVINSVVSGLLAMQWCALIAELEPSEDSAFLRLIIWIGTQLGICGFLYVLAKTRAKLAAPPCEALAWVAATVAGQFCNAALPQEGEGDALLVMAVLLVEQLTFYGLWMMLRTFDMGLKGWNIRGVQLGASGAPATDDPIARWRADCDSISWGAAPFALAGTTMRMLKFYVTHNATIGYSDREAWLGHGSFWGGSAAIFLLAIVIFSNLLSRMVKGHSGLTNIVGSTLLAALPSATAMCWLNFLRSIIYGAFCTHLKMCDTHKKNEVFLSLMVAYASTLLAMLSTMGMALMDGGVEGKELRTILQECQKAVGTQAALAWSVVFNCAANNYALDRVGLGQSYRLALLLTVTIGPLYIYYIRPSHCRAQEAKPAKAASHQD